MNPEESFQRFQNRAADYADGRPRYPAALVERLTDRLALRPGAVVADIGLGTGIFTRSLLESGLRVLAVEPSAAMPRTAESLLSAYPGFVSVNGSAQTTSLSATSVEAIFCAQAFQWFNTESTRLERQRDPQQTGRIPRRW